MKEDKTRKKEVVRGIQCGDEEYDEKKIRK
jgi:hypothetical protein